MGLLTIPEAKRALDQTDSPVPKAQMHIYHADSDNLAAVYKDHGLTLTQANPIKANDDGFFPACHLIEGAYRIKIETTRAKALFEADNVDVLDSEYAAVTPAPAFPGPADLAADNSFFYGPSSDGLQVAGGEMTVTQDNDFRYQVLPETATDADLTTAGGIKFKVICSPDGVVSDRQFGHIANDADRVNTAIAWAVKRQKAGHGVPRISVQGVYTMDKPIKAFDFDGTNFNYASIHIEGPAHGYVNNQRTKFIFTDKNNPGIVTQKIRQLKLKNIAIVGGANNLSLPSYDDLLARNGWWNVNGAVESGPYKMHAGICVDPFHSGMAAGQKFSAFDGSGAEPDHYLAPSGAGSTGITIENCDVQGWVVGVMCAASNVQIGDSITVEKCDLSYNRWPFFIGESQNRGCVMVDCHAKGFDALMVGGSGFGAGTGSLCYIRGGVFVFGHSIVNGEVTRGNGACTDAYFESVWAIGHIDGGHGFTFKDCQIKLIDAKASNLPDVDAHLTGNGKVNFLGGYIGKYANAPLRLKVVPKIFTDGVTFDNVPTFRDYTLHNMASVNCRYSSAEIRQCYLVDSMTGGFNNPMHGPGARIVVGDETWLIASGWDAHYLGVGATTVAGDGTATVTGLNLGAVQVGDEVCVLNGWSGLDNKGNPDTHRRIAIGYVDSISGATVTLKGVPVSFVTGSYSFYNWTLPLIHAFAFGDTTNGSDVITNMTTVTGWAVGQWIKGAGIPADTRVTAVSGTTITISKPATSTKAGVEIHDAKLVLEHKFRSSAPTSGTYPAGAFVKNVAPSVDGNGMILTGWIATTGGSPGTWQPVHQSSVSPAV